MKSYRFRAAAGAATFLLAALLAIPTRAQNEAAAVASQNNLMPMPPNVVKPFINWIVRCYPVASPVPCEMFQISTVRQTKQRIVAISIVYVPFANRYLIQVALPAGVDLLKGAIVRSNTFTSKALPYRRCDKTGCFVETIIANDAIAALARATPSAKIQIAGFRGRAILLPLSLNGFKDANEALVELAKQKAAKPPPGALSSQGRDGGPNSAATSVHRRS
jgi:invasion protein IalB